jgi:hypothetical protein
MLHSDKLYEPRFFQTSMHDSANPVCRGRSWCWQNQPASCSSESVVAGLGDGVADLWDFKISRRGAGVRKRGKIERIHVACLECYNHS